MKLRSDHAHRLSPRTDARIQAEAQKVEGKSHPIPCPMLGALAGEGHLTPDKDGKIELRQLDKAFKEVLGMSLPMRLSFRLTAPTSLSVTKLISNLIRREVDLHHLRGDIFDHKWDTGILAGGQFNQDAFDRMASFSSDGKTLTLAEWGMAMRAGLQQSRQAGADVPTGGASTLVESSFVTFEAGLIGSVLGRYDEQGTMRIALDDLLALYRDKKLPDSWSVAKEPTTLRKTLTGLAKAGFGIVMGSRGAGAALEGQRLALGKEAPAVDTALVGAMKGMCPMGAGAKQPEDAPSDLGQVTDLHERLD